jgi:hypothetical protein
VGRKTDSGEFNRFQILKGQTPPEKIDNNRILVSVDGKVIGKIETWSPSIFPEEALTTVNGQRGWLNKNGTFYPEELVKKELKKRHELLGSIEIQSLGFPPTAEDSPDWQGRP